MSSKLFPKSKMQYVEMEDCLNGLFQLAIDFDESQKTADYQFHKSGVAELHGVLQRVKNTWYDGCSEKAAYLLASIIKGHFFENGNKRIALIITLEFLHRNNWKKHKSIPKKSYAKWFKKNFPTYKLATTTFRTTYGWALYNLCKAIASDTTRDFDLLKKKGAAFIMLSFRQP